DKILEFVDAIYTGMAQEAQEPAPTPPAEHMSAQDAMGMIKDLVSDEGEQSRPKASTSWGRNDGNGEAGPGAQPKLGQACRRRVRDPADRIPPRGTGERQHRPSAEEWVEGPRRHRSRRIPGLRCQWRADHAGGEEHLLDQPHLGDA